MIDHPIAGMAGPAIYLDGTDWTVTSAPAPPPPGQTTDCKKVGEKQQRSVAACHGCH